MIHTVAISQHSFAIGAEAGRHDARGMPLQFVYELQKADKPFQLMLYPKSRHGVTDPMLIRHLRQLMFDYTVAHLKPGS